MNKLTVQELVVQFRALINIGPRAYFSGKSVFVVTRIEGPEGPVYIKRKSLRNEKSLDECPEEPISTSMLWRAVNALQTGIPVQLDRIFGASYNTRSALESMIACCSGFFMCHPARLTFIGESHKISEKNHKYLIWKPEMHHQIGKIVEIEVPGFISEVPSKEVYCDAVNIPNGEETAERRSMSEEIRRVHSQMQVLLSQTAHWMNLRSWVAVEDHGIVTGGQNILTYPYMVKDLAQEKVISNYPEAISVAKHIDCIWFNGGMPFVFEVEHTTGVTSGLTRMQRLHEKAVHTATDYVVVAPDADRSKVLTKADSEQYDGLSLWYMSYSALVELNEFSKKHCYRCGHRGRGEFTKMFMEQIRN